MTPVGTTVLGQRLLRREDAEILTGEAKYVDDLNIPGATTLVAHLIGWAGSFAL